MCRQNFMFGTKWAKKKLFFFVQNIKSHKVVLVVARLCTFLFVRNVCNKYEWKINKCKAGRKYEFLCKPIYIYILDSIVYLIHKWTRMGEAKWKCYEPKNNNNNQWKLHVSCLIVCFTSSFWYFILYIFFYF